MPARTRSHLPLPVHPPLHPPDVAPGPFQDAAFHPWPAAAPATSHAGPPLPAPLPTGPAGVRTRTSTQEDLEAGLSWEESQELPYKAQRPQTKTERQQMLNKAAQQRCASSCPNVASTAAVSVFTWGLYINSTFAAHWTACPRKCCVGSPSCFSLHDSVVCTPYV